MNDLLKNTVNELQEQASRLFSEAKYKSVVYGSKAASAEIRETAAYMLTAANKLKEAA